MSIRYKIAIIVSLMISLPVAVVGALSYWFGRDTLQQELYQHEEVLVEQKVRKISNDLQHYRDNAAVLAEMPLIRQLIDMESSSASTQESEAQREEWKNIVGQIFASSSSIDATIACISYLNTQGMEVVRVDSDSGQGVRADEAELRSRVHETYVQEGWMLTAGQVYVSPIELDDEKTVNGVSGSPIIRLVAPVYSSDGGSGVGLVVVNVRAAPIVDSLQNVGGIDPEALRSHRTVIIDEAGDYLYHPDLNVAFLHLLGGSNNYFVDQPELREHLQNADAFFYHDKEDQEFRIWKKFLYDSTNSERYWVVVSVVSANELFGSVNAFGLIVLFSTIGVAMAAAFLGHRISQRLVRPIELLTERANAISSGEYTFHVPSYLAQARDEIGILARAIDSMRLSIKRSHGSLERQVKKRTDELRVSLALTEKQKTRLSSTLADLQVEKKRSLAAVEDLQKFKLAVENASDQIVISDPDGFIVYANPAAETLTGFAVPDIIGKKAGAPDLWGGLMDKKYYEKMWDTIKVQKRPFIGEIRNKSKDGRAYTAAVSIAPILDDQGSVRFFVSTERDITKEKEIDKAKTEFVSLASHQLRTPLSAINWYAEMLLDGDAGKLSTKQKAFMKEIYDGNVRITNLVNALLNVSRLDLGTFMVKPEEVDLTEMVASVLKELQVSITGKKIKVTFSGPSKLAFMADRNLTRIIVQNIIGNAVKYTPAKGSVDILLRRSGKHIHLKVKDTGYGIPRWQQDKIFMKLFRADNVKEKETDGTGLGLYIVKSILDQVGGSISFLSQEGAGSTFSIAFPAGGMKKKVGDKQLERKKL